VITISACVAKEPLGCPRVLHDHRNMIVFIILFEVGETNGRIVLKEGEVCVLH
jgi:hypothetical protein